MNIYLYNSGSKDIYTIQEVKILKMKNSKTKVHNSMKRGIRSAQFIEIDDVSTDVKLKKEISS